MGDAEFESSGVEPDLCGVIEKLGEISPNEFLHQVSL